MSTNLGAFIRTQRERLHPATYGLALTERRRTPGLRREELALLCGVSVTWYTWLEQGRPVSASAKMLARMADVLRLSAAERKYLFKLADRVDPEAGLTGTQDATEGSDARAVVEAIQTPAYILDRQSNAIAWNSAAAELFTGWLGQSRGDRQPNLLLYMFTDPMARGFVADWPERARRLVAEYRADCGKEVDGPPIKQIVDELLQVSSDFRQLWEIHGVVDREGGMRQFLHPTAGLLTYKQATFQSPTRPGLNLIMLMKPPS
jgi:transcriptional regulator with XRE-family HTH domain